MHRAKLLNRSGWKMSLRILIGTIVNRLAITVGALALLTFPATGNAQRGTTLALSQFSAKGQSATRPQAQRQRNSQSLTQSNHNHRNLQQSQHRVSVAPQGGELNPKLLGRSTYDGTLPLCGQATENMGEICWKHRHLYGWDGDSYLLLRTVDGKITQEGGELEKKTGADSLEKRIELYDSSFAKTNYSWHYYTMREFAGIKSCHVGDIAIVGGQLLNCVAWDTWREWPTTAFYCPEACDRPPWQIPVPKELITPRE